MSCSVVRLVTCYHRPDPDRQTTAPRPPRKILRRGRVKSVKQSKQGEASPSIPGAPANHSRTKIAAAATFTVHVAPGSAAADKDPGEGDSQGPEQRAGPVGEDEVAGLFVGVCGADLLVGGDLDESGDDPEEKDGG